jgi:hypothetical protein
VTARHARYHHSNRGAAPKTQDIEIRHPVDFIWLSLRRSSGSKAMAQEQGALLRAHLIDRMDEAGTRFGLDR